jgi:molybdopterin molybdotransferase
VSELLSVREAQDKILAEVSTLPATIYPFEQAINHVLAEEIIAGINLPPFPNSGMDGFAVRSADVSSASRNHPAVLKVVADISAGSQISRAITIGEAARIMTGAPIPPGADAIIPVEETNVFSLNQANAATPETVEIIQTTAPGKYIRPEGQDIHQGETILHAGRRLQPQDVGLLAALGVTTVRVHPHPKVVIFSTGDELLEPAEPLTPGKIHNSNSYTLASLARKYCGEVLVLPIASDREEDIRLRFEQALQEKADLIVTSAGVSVGVHDYVRKVVEESGQLKLWRVNMRPGKPVAFGSYRGTPVFGLPGNPVSSYVGFLVFVVPVIMKLAGAPIGSKPVATAILEEPIESDGRESYLRAIVAQKDGQYFARLAGHQGSGNLFSLVQANALLIVPSGVKSLSVGTKADVWFLNDYLQGN